jgi:DNA-binding CsgD family transcriptional regulator
MASYSNPIQTKALSSLVAALYRGPFQEKPWSDFLEEVQSVFCPCTSVIGLRLPKPGDPGVVFVGGMDLSPTDHQEFADEFSALDPLVDLPDGEVVALDDVIPRKHLEKTTFYQAFMRPFNQAQSMGFDIHKDGKVALFARLMRGHGEADFSRRDRAILELLVPQFRELANWMASSRSHLLERSLFEQAFSRLAMATIILDADLQVVHMNSVAEQLLRGENGVACIDGRLRLTANRQNLLLQHSLAQILSDEYRNIPQVISMPRSSRSHPLLVTLKKLPSNDRMEGSHHIAVYMTAPEMRELDQEQLMVDVFGLTPQESRVVIALANGLALEEIADEMQIRKNTARSHLYSAFGKVGVSHQSSLVSHVIRCIYGI